MQPMKIMVRIQDRERFDSYDIENVDGFVSDVSPRLPKPMTWLDMEELPYHSTEVLSKLPAEDLRYFCIKHGKEISTKKFEKNLADGTWITSPSLQTVFVAALFSSYSGEAIPDRYGILAKLIEK